MTTEIKDTPAPEPDTTTTATPTPETTAAATPTPDGEAKSTPSEQALAAFAKGAVENTEGDQKPPAGVKLPETPEKKETAAPAKDGAAGKDASGKEAKPETDEKVEGEIKALDLKGKTAERFRELSKRPTPEDVEKTVAPLREQAEKLEQWNTILRDSTATPPQLDRALGYLQRINSGDPKSMREAYDAMRQEVAWLGKQLGEEVPGSYDPLKDHPDLAEKVANGEITRELALDHVRLRADRARTEDVDRRRGETERQTREQTEAQNAAKTALNQLGARLKASDPQYEAKIKRLAPALAYARENLPPAQWAGYVEQAYGLIEIAPPAATTTARVPVGSVPLRPSAPPAGQRAAIPKDPMAAFKLGLASEAGAA